MRLVSFSILLLLPRLALAGGSYAGEPDVVTMGEAAANVAAPSTIGAFWFNPASLAHQGGLQLQAEGGFQYTPSSFQRADNPLTGESYRLSTNLTPYKPAMLVGLTYDFGVPGLAVGAAAYSPVSSSYGFSENGAQRYQAIFANTIEMHVHLAVAYRVFKWMSLGVTFGNSYFATTQKVAIAASLTPDPEDPNFSVPFLIDVKDPFTITSNFGVRFDPIPELSIGASLAPPHDILASGTATVELPPALSGVGVSLQGNKVSVGLQLPMVARIGLRYRPIERLSIDAAFIWEQWSRFQTVELTPEDMRISAPIPGLSDGVQVPTVTLQKKAIDVYSARLGTEIRVLNPLVLRAGVYFETSSTTTRNFDQTVPDANKIGFSVGASVKAGPIWFDAAYVHARPFSRITVTDSEAQTTSVLPGATVATGLGNGTYDFNWHVAHFGIRGSFFDSPKPPPPLEPASASAPTTMPSP